MSFLSVAYGLRTIARNTIALMLSINKYIYMFHSITMKIAQLYVYRVLYRTCTCSSYLRQLRQQQYVV